MGLARALRGKMIELPERHVKLPESHGGPFEYTCGRLAVAERLTTNRQYGNYLDLYAQMEQRFGGLLFRPDGGVHSVVRAPTLREAPVLIAASLNLARALGLRGAYASAAMELVPTRAVWGGHFEALAQSGRAFLDPDKPAPFVSWFDAVGFADAQPLYETADGQHWGVRLPTSLEWHAIALAGRDPASTTYATASNTLDGVIWNRTELEGTASVVGEETVLAPRRSPDGVLDLAGQLWEWMADVSGGRYADLVPHPFGPCAANIMESDRSMRGRSWDSDCPYHVRLADRGSGQPTGRGDFAGVRLVAAPQDFPG